MDNVLIKTRVFLSYSRKDRDFVLRFTKILEELGASVWIDEWSIPPGSEWGKSIMDAISHCSHFVIILSPDSCNSVEVQNELDEALKNRKPIIPINIRDCQPPEPIKKYQFVKSRGPDDKMALEKILPALGLPFPEEAIWGKKWETIKKIPDPPEVVETDDFFILRGQGIRDHLLSVVEELDKEFSEEELKNLFSIVGLSYGNYDEKDKVGKICSLVEYAHLRRRFTDLVDLINSFHHEKDL